MTSMARRSMHRLFAMTALLAFLLPIAAAAETCDDCLWSDASGCCMPSCCACCIQIPSFLSAAAPADPQTLPDSGPAGEPVAVRRLLANPRDVFHVPRSSLA
jgi:hypothetical protein